MKLIIDIPETQYNNIMEVKSMSLGRIPYKGIIMNAIREIQNGTPIPDNATNGEIMQMMFPYYSYERNDYVQSTEDYIIDSMECMEHDLYFAYDWWNAPYQKGGK